MIAHINLNFLKKSLLAILFATTLSSNNLLSKVCISNIKKDKSTLYFGGFENLPTTNFCILYDGEIVKVSDQSFSIKDQMLANINIIFIDPDEISFSMEENTVISLKFKTNNYKCFKLESTQFPTPNSTKNNYLSTWNISDQKLNGIIPFNSIVIPINPNDAKIEVKNTTWKPNNLAIKLPTIKLTPKGDNKLVDLTVKSYLKTISLKPFHAKQKIKHVVRDAMKISMII